MGADPVWMFFSRLGSACVSLPIRLIVATLKRAASVWSRDILERGPTGPIKREGVGETQFSSFVSSLFLFSLSRCDDSVIVFFQLQPLHSHSGKKRCFPENHKASSLVLA